ncbi:hypothetical protein D3875_00325 [Deinococcus cavernae]|uniref:Uncharacterized protein n=1 Tax=Deinococcus cavernae TaxID=2320857 RepID=A0A418VIT6_9DEIO|nr:hypothetical protein D3875_00325 [Deinococcus cavernae]
MLKPEAASDAAGGEVPAVVSDAAERPPTIRSKTPQSVDEEKRSPPDWLAHECEELAEMVEQLEVERAAQPFEGLPGSLEEAQRRLHATQSARIHIQTIAATLTPTERPTADEVAGAELLEALRPKRGKGAGTEGAARLWRLLHLLAIYKAERSGHSRSAVQEAVHTANELLAVKLRVNPKTVGLWADQLQQAGKIEARSHHGEHLNPDTGEIETRVTGTLYAVALQPGHTARLTYHQLHHRHRRLDADRAVGRTAHRYVKRIKALYAAEKNMSESGTSYEGAAGDPEQIAVRVLQAWAVTPGGGAEFLDTRSSFDPDIFREEKKPSLQTVIYDLPLIADEQNPDRRRALVHHAAGSMAAALDDEHSRAYYAGLIWQAIKDGWKGLQALAAQLARLEIDCREWTGLRRPAALLAARLRAA